MRTNKNKQTRTSGSVLMITLCTCVILGILMGSYLQLAQAQRRSVARSQQWNYALVVAEAGVEEAMALLNSGVKAPNLYVPPVWAAVGGGVFKKANTNHTASKFGNSYYEVVITNGFAGSNPVIVAKSYAPGPVGSPVLTRSILVNTKPHPTFPVKGPMIVKQGYTANGYNVQTDSFAGGTYDPNTAGTNGDIVTLSTNANSVVIGNGKINGTVHTPAGGKQGITATVGSNGSVGDQTWVDGGNTGFQSGHFKDDFNQTDFPDATLPNAPAWFGAASGTASDGFSYTYLLGNNGNYKINGNVNGSIFVSKPNTVLYVTGNVSVGSGGGGSAAPQIHIASGASLILYVGGSTTSISGNGVVNDSKDAKNFQYYGLPTNTSIDITGNGAFYGTIYAPQADLNLKGSGNSSYEDFTGSSITKTTKMTGNFNFHYDESLIYLTTIGGYDAISWDEL